MHPVLGRLNEERRRAATCEPTLGDRRRSARAARGFSVFDPGDAADLLDMVSHDHLGPAATVRRFPRKATLLDLYSRAVNTPRPLSEVIYEVAPWSADRVEDVAESCRGYVTRKRALGMFDCDDLLLHWRAAARDVRLGVFLPASSTTCVSMSTRTSTRFRWICWQPCAVRVAALRRGLRAYPDAPGGRGGAARRGGAGAPDRLGRAECGRRGPGPGVSCGRRCQTRTTAVNG